MSMKVWKEKVEEMIVNPLDAKMLSRVSEVEYYEIVCDYCGKVIMNSKTGEGLGSGYVETSDGKHYHMECWEAMKIKEKMEESRE